MIPKAPRPATSQLCMPPSLDLRPTDGLEDIISIVVCWYERHGGEWHCRQALLLLVDVSLYDQLCIHVETVDTRFRPVRRIADKMQGSCRATNWCGDSVDSVWFPGNAMGVFANSTNLPSMTQTLFSPHCQPVRLSISLSLLIVNQSAVMRDGVCAKFYCESCNILLM
jgi:hypothetical protein